MARTISVLVLALACLSAGAATIADADALFKEKLWRKAAEAYEAVASGRGARRRRRRRPFAVRHGDRTACGRPRLRRACGRRERGGEYRIVACGRSAAVGGDGRGRWPQGV